MPGKTSMQQVTINQTDMKVEADIETKEENINLMEKEELKERLNLTLTR